MLPGEHVKKSSQIAAVGAEKAVVLDVAGLFYGGVVACVMEVEDSPAF
jgi:glycine cleavage system H lipoate-binding protein